MDGDADVTKLVAAVMAFFACLVVVGCPESGTTSTVSTGPSEESVVVFAAASLTDAFGAVAAAYEQAHQGTRVELSLAASSTVREQVLDGAPADVVATAGWQIMNELAAADALDGSAVVVARNRLMLATPIGNPGSVANLHDLGRPGLLVGLCHESVPCGRLAGEALAAAAVEVSPATTEPDVRALLAKIEVGELDAGLVYASDVVASDGAVEGFELDPVIPADVDYPVAVVKGASNAAGAEQFIRFVEGPGRASLMRHGFGAPLTPGAADNNPGNSRRYFWSWVDLAPRCLSFPSWASLPAPRGVDCQVSAPLPWLSTRCGSRC